MAGDELAERFSRDGFLIVPRMYSAAEVAGYKAECRRLLRAAREQRPEAADPFPGGVFVGLALRSPLFARAAADPRVVAVLTRIIGPDVLFLSDKVAFKNGAEDRASPWHQDHPYWRGPHKVSVWIALDAATPENGCLKLIPGSHRAPVRHDRVDGSHGFGHRVLEQDDAGAVSAPLQPGGAVIFHDLTLHASHPNRSGADRWAVITTYRDARAAEAETMAWPAARLVAGGAAGDPPTGDRRSAEGASPGPVE